MAAGRVVAAVSFDALERDFLREVRERGSDLERRTWVLAPTNLLRLHLMRAAGRAEDGMRGVEFLTLTDAAWEVASTDLARDGLRPLPAWADELVIEQALGALPLDGFFGRIGASPGAPRAAVRAIGLLANALWTPESLREASTGLGAGGADLAGRLREIATLWQALATFERAHGLFRPEHLLARGAEAGRERGPHSLLLYGFYDLTPLQERFVAALAGGAEETSVHLLWHEARGRAPAPGFEYAAPFVQWALRETGAESVECLGQDADGTDLARLRARIFSAAVPGPAGELPEFDGSVRVASCPGDAAEADQIVRELLRAPDGAGVETAAVIGRTATEVADAFEESRARAGIECFVHRGPAAARTAAGRILLGLADLAAGDGERTAVVGLLSVAHVDWPEDLSPTALDRASRDAGIVSGWLSWGERLAVSARDLDAKAERSDHEPEAEGLRLRARQARAARRMLAGFFDEVRGLGACETWAQIAARLAVLFVRYAPHDAPGMREARDVIDRIAQLDATGVRPELSCLTRLLRTGLAEAHVGREKFGRRPVTVSGVMETRGTTHDVVIVPHLVEKGFPRRIPADPVLSDRDRETLSQLAEALGCGALPVGSGRTREEQDPMRLALGSARRGVVLLYPRIEEGGGRPRVPSRFIRETCEALCGRRVSSEEIENAALGALVTRVRGAAGVDPAASVDGGDYDLAVFAGAADQDAAADYAGGRAASFARAREMDRSRWRSDAFGPCDGRITSPPLLEALRERYARFDAPISSSRLEKDAACPFLFFAQYVLGVEEIEKPAEEFEPEPSERGQIVHEVLAAAYAACLRGKRLGGLSEADVDAAMTRAEEVIDTVGRAHAEARPGVWGAARAKMLASIRRLIRAEGAEAPDAVPEEFELAFGLSDEAAGCRLTLEDGATVCVRGRIDRVDRLPDGGIRVLDYKTGKSKNKRKNSLAGGQQLQLPLYLLAAAEALGAGSGRAGYAFLADMVFQDQCTLDALRVGRDRLVRALSLITAGIAAGEFFPLPGSLAKGSCKDYCPCINACGQTRTVLAAAKEDCLAAERLRELRAIEGLDD